MFYEREQWKKPLLVSVGFHGFLVLAIFALGFILGPHGTPNNWGANNGDTITAQMVSASIPIPHNSESQNILANDSKGMTKSIPQPREEETPDGISIPSKVTPKHIDKPVPQNHVQPARPVPTPQETAVPFGDTGPVSGPYGAVSTTAYKGGFSFHDADFGSLYSWYVKVVKDKVQQNWLTYEIDPRIKAPHRAYIEFDIEKNGTPTNVHIAQSSGVPTLDTSAVRAIQRIDTFGPLPKGNSITVEFWFDYPPN